MSVAIVPPEELYFAVLDAPVSNGRSRSTELDYAFEAALPADLSEFHTRYLLLPDGRVLAVGIDKKTAAELGTNHHAATPAAWPDWIDQKLPDPASVNLLTGNAEPRTVRNERSRLAARMAVLATVVSLTASIGLERRIRIDNDRSSLLRADSRELIRSALGESANRSSQPLSAVLVSELRRLRTTRGQTQDQDESRSRADAALAEVLSAWPLDAFPKTESIVIAERSIELAILVTDSKEAQRFVTAMADIDGLLLATTSSSQESGGTRLSIRLDREVAP